MPTQDSVGSEGGDWESSPSSLSGEGISDCRVQGSVLPVDTACPSGNGHQVSEQCH